MAAQQLIQPQIYVGTQYAGYKYFVYDVGTTTKQTIWTDSTQGTTQSNPATVDANGFINIFVNGNFKVVLAAAEVAGAPSGTVWTQDECLQDPDGISISALTSVTVATGDLVLIEDISNSNAKGQTTAGDIANLAATDLVNDTSPQLGGDLDANAFDIQFDDATGIRDSNDNEQLIFQETASAVNHFEITNAATGSEPLMQAVGDDTDVSFRVQSKGAGTIELEDNTNVTGTLSADVTLTVDGSASSAGEIRLAEDTDNGTNYMGFKSPAAVTSSLSFELPDGDGTANQILETDGSGVLSWVTPSAGAMTFLASATASASSTLDFVDGTGGFVMDSTYDVYVFDVIELIAAANSGQELWVRTRVGGSFATDSTYTYAKFVTKSDSTNASSGSTGTTRFVLANGIGITDDPVSGRFYVFNPAGTSNRMAIMADISTITDSTVKYQRHIMSGNRTDTSAVDGIQILFGGTTMTTGKVNAYGMNLS